MTTDVNTSNDTAARQRYRVVKKIDAGGMAEIYLARAIGVGGIEKTVVIKRVLPNLTRNKRFVNMFLDEARLSMLLTHANIVQVFDVGHADGTYFIVMEYVEGTNLRRVFQLMSETGQKLEVKFAAYVMAEVCKGLAHAHEKLGPDGESMSIVHRDISPPNILISDSGEVKITDFGLAKAKTQLELTDPGIVKGKFSYLSPEAADGKPVDHRADLFCIGILTWELLANRRLFLGKSDLETVELIRKADVPRLSLFNKDVTEEFENIVERALARDPKKRFHSARDLGTAFSDYLFANNLKVTNYELAEFVRNLDSADEQAAKPLARIGELIDEEVADLRVMEVLNAPAMQKGAKPLNDLEMVDSTADHLLNVTDIWSLPDGPPISGDPKLAAMLEDYRRNRTGAFEMSDSAILMQVRKAPLFIVALLVALLAVVLAMWGLSAIPDLLGDW